jgi:hypothetical protein
MVDGYVGTAPASRVAAAPRRGSDLAEELDRLGGLEHAGRSILRSLIDVNVKWMG